MMRPSYTQSYENPGYPQSIPNYWGGYPQQMPYYQQPMQPYPYQMAGDYEMQKLSGQNLYQLQSFPEQPMTIGTNPGTNNSAAISTTVSATLPTTISTAVFFTTPISTAV